MEVLNRFSHNFFAGNQDTSHGDAFADLFDVLIRFCTEIVDCLLGVGFRADSFNQIAFMKDGIFSRDMDNVTLFVT